MTALGLGGGVGIGRMLLGAFGVGKGFVFIGAFFGRPVEEAWEPPDAKVPNPPAKRRIMRISALKDIRRGGNIWLTRIRRNFK